MKFSKHKKREPLTVQRLRRAIAAAQRRRLGRAPTIQQLIAPSRRIHHSRSTSLRRKLTASHSTAPSTSRVESPLHSNSPSTSSNSMEGVLVCDSSVNQPVPEPVPPLPLTEEAIMALNNYSVTFEHARSLFQVDLATFKARLMELNILVWNEANGARVRIHGGNHKITIFFKLLRKYYVVEATDSFFDIILMIERDLALAPDSYELTYEQPQTLINTLLRTDLDWHFAAESSRERGFVLLNVNTNDQRIVNYMAAYDEYSSDSDAENF